MENTKIKGWIYIHIPKTAGMFIKSRIKESRDTSKILDPFATNNTYSIPVKNAPSISFVRQEIELSNDNRIGFVVIVRNPYDRMYSMWKWLRINGHVGNFDFPNVEEKFEEYLLNLKNGKYDNCYFMQRQTFWFTSEEDCYVKTMKFEELNTTVKTFFESNNVIWSDVKVNTTFGINYDEVYNTQMRNIVIERCGEEFEKFNYPLDL
jgi:hypothetical protein